MRKGKAPQRPLVKDPVYNSTLVTQLVNKVLLDGKKATAERIVYGALEACREKTGTDPVGTLEKALGNIRPELEFVPAASVAQPTRFRLRFAPAAPTPSLSAGS